MKDQQTQTPIIEEVPFEQLSLSDLNPRQEVDPDGIDQLAENIRALGLIHNLAGLRQEDGTVTIVAGGRRLRALAMLQDEERFQSIPVQIAPDEATARHWAAAENHQRERLHPADEIENFRALSVSGASVPEIALAFGVSERHVYRRLALAALPDAVLAALRADEITLAMAACFTVANDETCAVDVLEQVRGQAVSERHLKSLLQPEAVASSDRRARFVGTKAYVAAGGTITSDLFGEADFWTDSALLDSLFLETLTKAAEDERVSGGWSWAEIDPSPYLGWYELEARNCARLYPDPGRLTDEEEATLEALMAEAEPTDLSADDTVEFERLEAKAEGSYTDQQKAHAGMICYVNHEGVLQTCAGLVRPEDRQDAIAAGVLQASRHETDAAKPRAVISAALARDLEATMRGARQSAFLDHPDLLLDLLAFQLSGKGGYAHALAIRTDQPDITPTTETGYAPDPRLQGALGSDAPPSVDGPTAFKRFRKQSKARRRECLIRALAALVDPMADDLKAMLDGLIDLDVRRYWTPTAENFFGRVPAQYLETLWKDLTGLKPDHPTITTFKRLKKKEKAAKLETLFAAPDAQAALGLSATNQAALTRWYPEPDA